MKGNGRMNSGNECINEKMIEWITQCVYKKDTVHVCSKAFDCKSKIVHTCNLKLKMQFYTYLLCNYRLINFWHILCQPLPRVVVPSQCDKNEKERQLWIEIMTKTRNVKLNLVKTYGHMH